MGYAEAKPEATPIQAEDLLHLGDRAAVDELVAAQAVLPSSGNLGGPGTRPGKGRP